MKRFTVLSVLSCAFLLTGCVTQEQADAKMAKGCEAGVNALISPRTIQEIKVRRYTDEQAEGGLHRRITLEAVEKDGWLELDREYSCLFMEEWSLFKSGHKALLIQVNADGEVYGKKDGRIIGDLDDFLALTDAVETAMGQETGKENR